MALDKAGLTAALTAIFEDVSGTTAAVKAAQIANAIDAYVKTGQVSFTVGQFSGSDSGGDTPVGVVAAGGAIT